MSLAPEGIWTAQHASSRLTVSVIAQAVTILCMDIANEKRSYYVTSPLIGGAYIQNDPC